MRYTIKGFVKIPFSLSMEGQSIQDALSRAETRGDELAKGSVRVLKERAANLAGDMCDEKHASAVITSVTS